MSVIQRRVRITAKPKSLRERELEAHYLNTLRRAGEKYKKLEAYNTRLYKGYTRLHSTVTRAINAADDEDGTKREAQDMLREEFIQPFHPLK